MLETVACIRSEDPGIGCRKLWLMLRSVYGADAVPGRDSFFRLLRRRGLVLPRPKPRRTTDSNHRYHKWKNLVRGFTPTGANQVWVADITYIPLEYGGTCYLHLVTDAYSRKIVGWRLSPSLRASESLDALGQAIRQAAAMRGSDRLDGLVHHSDRGVQYCCDAYRGGTPPAWHRRKHDRGLQPHGQRRGRTRQRHRQAGGGEPPPRLQRHGGGPPRHRPLHPFLQQPEAAHEHRRQDSGCSTPTGRGAKKHVEKNLALMPASTLDTKVSRQEVLKKGNVNTCSTDNPIV